MIFIYVELENYDEAITLSEELLSNNLDDPDIFFNVGVIYQRLASKYYDKGFDDYNVINASENIGKLILRKKLQNIEPLTNLNLARTYSLTYYYQNKALNGKENYQELSPKT